MLEFWMHEVALVLFVWVIAHHYQYWGIVGFLKKTPPRGFNPHLLRLERSLRTRRKNFKG